MTNKQKAVQRYLDSGGTVQQCPLGYAVAPVANTIRFNPLSRGSLQWSGNTQDLAMSGCRSTIRYYKSSH